MKGLNTWVTGKQQMLWFFWLSSGSELLELISESITVFGSRGVISSPSPSRSAPLCSVVSSKQKQAGISVSRRPA